jgi:hypothetical protein
VPAPTPLRIFQVFGCAINNIGIGEFDIHSGPQKNPKYIFKGEIYQIFNYSSQIGKGKDG